MTIFYICPWAEMPTGGIKQIFRHVEALGAAGFDAYVLALEREMPDWFNSSAAVARVMARRLFWHPSRAMRRKNRVDWIASAPGPVVEMATPGGASTRRRLDKGDIIVLPEYLGSLLRPCAFGAQMVVFNQNAHYTYKGFGHADDLSKFVYRNQLVAALAVSNHTHDYLKFAFPDLPVYLTPNGVDASRFHPGEQAKKRQIAFMPRKLPTTIVQVLQILQGRGSLAGWSLCPIDGMGEEAVAAHLRESAIFLSTSSDEGFGLPPLEAGASGCIVVGYTGYGAREFMLPEYCYPIEQGDVIAFAQTLEKVVREYDADPSRLQRQTAEFGRFLQDKYSKSVEAAQVVAAWSDMCGPGGQRCVGHASTVLPTVAA